MKFKSIALILFAGLVTTSSVYANTDISNQMTFEIKCSTGNGYPVDWTFSGINGVVTVSSHDLTLDFTHKYSAKITHLDYNNRGLDLRFHMDGSMATKQHLRLNTSSDHDGGLYAIDLDRYRGAGIASVNTFEKCSGSFF